jgi:hypothetical protein
MKVWNLAVLFVLVTLVAFTQGKSWNGPNKESLPYYDFFSIGVGLPAVSVHLSDGNIGFFDSVSPAMATFSPEPFQEAWVIGKTESGLEYLRVSYWSMATGINISKPQNGNIQVGVTLIPYMLRIGPYSIGIGILWSVSTVFSLGLDTFSVILPLTYSFGG